MSIVSVHPRVCGEQGTPFPPTPCQIGSSQRVRGTGYQATQVFDIGGSSPRVRGTVYLRDIVLARCRFIPACAGNSVRIWPPRLFTAVHPRVCGEQIEAGVCAVNSCGSSPRVRGTVPYDLIYHCVLPVHPRVCGEQTCVRIQATQSGIGGSSPRVRGTGFVSQLALNNLRFIPACAGNSSISSITACHFSVHPRVCGEQNAILSLTCGYQRFIPACAGNSP